MFWNWNLEVYVKVRFLKQMSAFYLSLQLKLKTDKAFCRAQVCLFQFYSLKYERNMITLNILPVCVCVCVYVCVCAQSCLTLCDPIDCGLAGSSVHGIVQARILEWVAISYSRDLPEQGIKPMIPRASCIAGGLLTTAPPGKYLNSHRKNCLAWPTGAKGNLFQIYWFEDLWSAGIMMCF